MLLHHQAGQLNESSLTDTSISTQDPQSHSSTLQITAQNTAAPITYAAPSTTSNVPVKPQRKKTDMYKPSRVRLRQYAHTRANTGTARTPSAQHQAPAPAPVLEAAKIANLIISISVVSTAACVYPTSPTELNFPVVRHTAHGRARRTRSPRVYFDSENHTHKSPCHCKAGFSEYVASLSKRESRLRRSSRVQK